MEVLHPFRAWRVERGLTQAAAQRVLGIAKPSISKIENWRRVPSLALAAKLSERTGISIEKFARAD